MKERQCCPLCERSGLTNYLQSFQINLDEAILLCQNKKCTYPLGLENNYGRTYNRQLADLGSGRCHNESSQIPESQLQLQAQVSSHMQEYGQKIQKDAMGIQAGSPQLRKKSTLPRKLSKVENGDWRLGKQLKSSVPNTNGAIRDQSKSKLLNDKSGISRDNKPTLDNFTNVQIDNGYLDDKETEPIHVMPQVTDTQYIATKIDLNCQQNFESSDFGENNFSTDTGYQSEITSPSQNLLNNEDSMLFDDGVDDLFYDESISFDTNTSSVGLDKIESDACLSEIHHEKTDIDVETFVDCSKTVDKSNICVPFPSQINIPSELRVGTKTGAENVYSGFPTTTNMLENSHKGMQESQDSAIVNQLVSKIDSYQTETFDNTIVTKEFYLKAVKETEYPRTPQNGVFSSVTDSVLPKTAKSMKYPVYFPQWSNKDSLSWIDVLLCLIVHNQTLQQAATDGKLDSSCIVYKLIKAHEQARKLIVKINAKSVENEKSENAARQGIGPDDLSQFSDHPGCGKNISKCELFSEACAGQTALKDKNDCERMTKTIADNPNSSDSEVEMAIMSTLGDIREDILDQLKPKLNHEKGETVRPETVLPLLLQDNRHVEDTFTMKYNYQFSCPHCSCQQLVEKSHMIPSLSRLVADFNIGEPELYSQCLQCGDQSGTRAVIYNRLSECILMHFPDGLPRVPLSDLQFGFHGNLYTVTGLVQHIDQSEHFIAWLRNPNSDQWMQCDNLQSPTCTYQTPTPDIPSSQIYLIMWEKLQTTAKIYKQLQPLPTDTAKIYKQLQPVPIDSQTCLDSDKNSLPSLNEEINITGKVNSVTEKQPILASTLNDNIECQESVENVRLELKKMLDRHEHKNYTVENNIDKLDSANAKGLADFHINMSNGNGFTICKPSITTVLSSISSNVHQLQANQNKSLLINEREITTTTSYQNQSSALLKPNALSAFQSIKETNNQLSLLSNRQQLVDPLRFLTSSNVIQRTMVDSPTSSSSLSSYSGDSIDSIRTPLPEFVTSMPAGLLKPIPHRQSVEESLSIVSKENPFQSSNSLSLKSCDINPKSTTVTYINSSLVDTNCDTESITANIDIENVDCGQDKKIANKKFSPLKLLGNTRNSEPRPMVSGHISNIQPSSVFHVPYQTKNGEIGTKIPEAKSILNKVFPISNKRKREISEERNSNNSTPSSIKSHKHKQTPPEMKTNCLSNNVSKSTCSTPNLSTNNIQDSSTSRSSPLSVCSSKFKLPSYLKKKVKTPSLSKDAFKTFSVEKSSTQNSPCVSPTQSGNTLYLSSVKQYLIGKTTGKAEPKSKFEGLNLKSGQSFSRSTNLSGLKLSSSTGSSSSGHSDEYIRGQGHKGWENKQNGSNISLTSSMRKVKNSNSAYSEKITSLKSVSHSNGRESAKKLLDFQKQFKRQTPYARESPAKAEHEIVRQLRQIPGVGDLESPRKCADADTGTVLKDLYEALNIPYNKVKDTMTDIITDVTDIIGIVDMATPTPADNISYYGTPAKSLVFDEQNSRDTHTHRHRHKKTLDWYVITKYFQDLEKMTSK